MDDRPTCQPELQSSTSWTLPHKIFNILKDVPFRESNRVLDGVLKHNKAEGHEKAVEHKTACHFHSFRFRIFEIWHPVTGKVLV